MSEPRNAKLRIVNLNLTWREYNKKAVTSVVQYLIVGDCFVHGIMYGEWACSAAPKARFITMPSVNIHFQSKASFPSRLVSARTVSYNYSPGFLEDNGHTPILSPHMPVVLLYRHTLSFDRLRKSDIRA